MSRRHRPHKYGAYNPPLSSPSPSFQKQRITSPPNEDFLDFLNEYVASADTQDALLDAIMTAPKPVPKFSPASSQAPCMTQARRHLLAILRTRGPVSDDDVANATLTDVISGPMSFRVWTLVYELADLDKRIGNKMECERLKYDLVQELTMCIRWEPGMDPLWEAETLVEDMFPRKKRY